MTPAFARKPGFWDHATQSRTGHDECEERNGTRAGQGQQQEVLQAEVEIARQKERDISLRRAKQVAVARLNTLMHLPPDTPLTPPGNAPPAPLPDVARLREAVPLEAMKVAIM
ncbi:MAG: hypothetical protein K8U57_15050 [Planctomycetes bacterium]|nr:hypothetical protein [Planctomycetota bacterium]